ncbi:MAG: thiazole synthase [Sulfurospirillaceae bacterium]|nr:thiazole synthase [Sulfurospirillaceae bacterium]
MDSLKIGGKEFSSRLLSGTGKFRDKNDIKNMLEHSGSQIITIALRRVNLDNPQDNILNFIPKEMTLLPNTSGARNAEEAVRIANIAREFGCGNFIKIEIIHDSKYLMPDNEETIKATKILANDGFVVLPYITPDLVTCKKLEDAGASTVMPLGSPIGSNRGVETKSLIELIIENSNVPVIVDAGIGMPSHAALAMEMGADAVLINTAIATAADPVKAGHAFSLAVQAGRMAYLAKIANKTKYANASSPLTGFLNL